LIVDVASAALEAVSHSSQIFPVLRHAPPVIFCPFSRLAPPLSRPYEVVFCWPRTNPVLAVRAGTSPSKLSASLKSEKQSRSFFSETSHEIAQGADGRSAPLFCPPPRLASHLRNCREINFHLRREISASSDVVGLHGQSLAPRILSMYGRPILSSRNCDNPTLAAQLGVTETIS